MVMMKMVMMMVLVVIMQIMLNLNLGLPSHLVLRMRFEPRSINSKPNDSNDGAHPCPNNTQSYLQSYEFVLLGGKR